MPQNLEKGHEQTFKPKFTGSSEEKMEKKKVCSWNFLPEEINEKEWEEAW